MKKTADVLNNLSDLHTQINSDIGYFFSKLPPEISEKLDYSVDSVVTFETWLLQNYVDDEDLMGDPDEKLVNGAVFYYGEMYRKHIGGQWKIDPSLAKYIHHLSELTIVENSDDSLTLIPYEHVLEALLMHFDDYPLFFKQGFEVLIDYARRHKPSP